MNAKHTATKRLSALVAASIGCAAAALADDSLPSWKDTAPKRNIITFVEKVIKPGSLDFFPVPGRITYSPSETGCTDLKIEPCYRKQISFRVSGES